MSDSVKILLLGGGYSLGYLAKELKESFVITSRDKTKFSSSYKYVENLDIFNIKDIEYIVEKYPNIEVIIDSIPTQGVERLKNKINENKFESYLKNLKLFSKLNIKQYVYLSTTGVYGVTDGSIVTEQTQTNPISASGLARLNVENFLREIYKSKLNILRLSAIYGKDRGVINSLKSGRYPLVGNGERFTNRIHVQDIVLAILKIMDNPKFDIVNLKDGDNLTQKELVKYFVDKFEYPNPKGISLEGVKISGMLSLLSNQQIDNKRLLELVGSLRFKSIKDINW